MKPHIGNQVIFVGSIFPRKEIDERINEIILQGREKQAIAQFSPRAHQFMQLGKRSQKKIACVVKCLISNNSLKHAGNETQAY